MTLEINDGYASVRDDSQACAAVRALLGCDPVEAGYHGHNDLTVSCAQVAIAHLARIAGIARSEYGTDAEPRLDLLSATTVRLHLHRAGRRTESRMIGAWQRGRALSRASASLAGASSLTHSFALLAAAQPRSLEEMGAQLIRAALQ